MTGSTYAAELQGDPGNYMAQLARLTPGDTLHLAAGTYPNQLVLSNLSGTAQAWITVTGPETGTPAIFTGNACCNTVEITNSSYVAVRHLTIDGMHIAGAFGLSAKGATGNLVHHIRVEYNTFINQDGSQQQVAISTKTPTWGWEIRGNRIIGAGTGLYLGNSDGSDAFIGGLIERNLIKDTIGYNGEIKFQMPRATQPGIPTGDSTTIVRDNVFCKNDQASPSGDRPNFLVGGFPSTGAGSNDRYEIYRNLFHHNPRESLLQASGRVTIHDNIFVDVPGNAVLLQNHDLPLRQAYVYNNTIYSAGTGIRFGSTAGQGDGVVGNLVFAGTPITGTITTQRDNLTAPVAMAANFVQRPSIMLSTCDLYPLPGTCSGSALDLSAFSADTDWNKDWIGNPKGTQTFRGAYAGEGLNPGWQLDCDVKESSTYNMNPIDDAGVRGPQDPIDTGTEPTGCSCNVGGNSGALSALSTLLLGMFFLLRLRRRSAIKD